MDGPAEYATWEAKRAELRRRLAARRPCLAHAGPLRLAAGAYVEPGALSARLWARQAFLQVAGDAEPALLVSLADAPLDEYAAAWDAHGGPAEADPSWPPGRDLDRLFRAFMVGALDSRGPTGAWVRRWGFPARFDPPRALCGDDRALLRFAAEHCWGLGVAGITLHTWRAHPLPSPDRLRLAEPFAVLSSFADEDLGLGGDIALPVQAWDPQRETRAAAQARILNDLRRAVRAELRRIEGEARARAAPPPAKRTGVEHLVWLARYQLRGESFAQIARDAGKERQSVAEAVKGAAALVGLPLRPASPPGRPRQRLAPPRTVRLPHSRL